MFASRGKTVVALLLAMGVGAGGMWVWTCARLGAQPAEPPQPEKAEYSLASASEKRVRALLEGSNADPKMKALLRDRFAAARAASEQRYQQYLAGRGTLDMLLKSFEWLFEAERDLSDRKADHVVALKNYLQNLKLAEEIVTAQYRAGRASLADYEQARYLRLRAEIWLERAAER